MITARNFSSCPSDSISRWTPCPPETASGGFRSALAVSDFRLRARLDVSIPSTSPASEAFNPAFGYSAPHPSTEGTSTLLINALLSAHHDSIGDSRPIAFSDCPRETRINSETWCRGTLCLRNQLRLTLESARLKNPTDHRQKSIPGMDGYISQRRSSCLLFQMFGVEAHSFLPNR